MLPFFGPKMDLTYALSLILSVAVIAALFILFIKLLEYTDRKIQYLTCDLQGTALRVNFRNDRVVRGHYVEKRVRYMGLNVWTPAEYVEYNKYVVPVVYDSKDLANHAMMLMAAKLV